MKYDLVVKLPCDRDFPMSLNLDMNPSEVLEMVFAWFNHGSGQECVPFLEAKCRSLSVNDFVKMNGQWYRCDSLGWSVASDEMVNKTESMIRDLIGNKPGTDPWLALHVISRM